MKLLKIALYILIDLIKYFKANPKYCLKKGKAYIEQEIPFWWYCFKAYCNRLRWDIGKFLGEIGIMKKMQIRKCKSSPLAKDWGLREWYIFDRDLQRITDTVNKMALQKRCGVAPLED